MHLQNNLFCNTTISFHLLFYLQFLSWNYNFENLVMSILKPLSSSKLFPLSWNTTETSLLVPCWSGFVRTSHFWGFSLHSYKQRNQTRMVLLNDLTFTEMEYLDALEMFWAENSSYFWKLLFKQWKQTRKPADIILKLLFPCHHWLVPSRSEIWPTFLSKSKLKSFINQFPRVFK